MNIIGPDEVKQFLADIEAFSSHPSIVVNEIDEGQATFEVKIPHSTFDNPEYVLMATFTMLAQRYDGDRAILATNIYYYDGNLVGVLVLGGKGEEGPGFQEDW